MTDETEKDSIWLRIILYLAISFAILGAGIVISGIVQLIQQRGVS